ncbi:MAG: 16S rRNA (guanine(966)-N(2))-methyltransferase RsmD [Gammaproteobacteria bacterium]|nr:16S rRNA (guanine(966)-N(2))-methyltransferase RsmD [Gammaproteobacteria bacterium]
MVSNPPKNAPGNRFRIIAGQWRGRRIGYAAGTTARPTGDRVRETLFNWLNPLVEGTRCLDLFAGSGALGLEALSRGAREVVFVDRDQRLMRSLSENIEKLGCSNATVYTRSAEKWLETFHSAFDVVFLDPPFGDHVLDNLCKLIGAKDTVRQGGYCYLEMAATAPTPELPPGWTVLRDKRAGQVRFQLVQVNGEGRQEQ